MLVAFIFLAIPIVGLVLFAKIIDYIVKRIGMLQDDDPTGKSRN